MYSCIIFVAFSSMLFWSYCTFPIYLSNFSSLKPPGFFHHFVYPWSGFGPALMFPVTKLSSEERDVSFFVQMESPALVMPPPKTRQAEEVTIKRNQSSLEVLMQSQIPKHLAYVLYFEMKWYIATRNNVIISFLQLQRKGSRCNRR